MCSLLKFHVVMGKVLDPYRTSTTGRLFIRGTQSPRCWDPNSISFYPGRLGMFLFPSFVRLHPVLHDTSGLNGLRRWFSIVRMRSKYEKPIRFIFHLRCTLGSLANSESLGLTDYYNCNGATVAVCGFITTKDHIACAMFIRSRLEETLTEFVY